MATFSEIDREAAADRARELLRAANDRQQLAALIDFDPDDPYLHSGAFGYAVAVVRELLGALERLGGPQ